MYLEPFGTFAVTIVLLFIETQQTVKLFLQQVIQSTRDYLRMEDKTTHQNNECPPQQVLVSPSNHPREENKTEHRNTCISH